MQFIANLILLLIYMTIWFAIGWHRKRLDTVDTAWGGGFILLAVNVTTAHGLPAAILVLLVIVWGFRLIYHIWWRNSGKKPDPRYEELSAKWPKRRFWPRAYISIFLLQGLLIYLIGLPITIVGAAPTYLVFSWLTGVGVALWVVGFTIEAIADSQLGRFIRAPHSKGAVMQDGLWHYSRHPNYFGELLQWWGIALIALPAHLGWLGLVGPLTLTWLIVFVSGIPPIERRKRDNAEYQDYARRTSVLIPLPPR